MLEFAQGATGRLLVEYKDENGDLTDPTTPLLDILNPSNSVVVNDAVPTRDSQGLYYYDFAVPLAAPLGEWTARWSGTINSALLSADDTFLVVEPGEISFGSQANIITLSEYKSLMGIQAGNSTKDLQIAALLPAASRAVRSFTGRRFELASGPATEREFQYDESGILDIDDCTSVSLIETDAGVLGQTYTLTSDQWTVMPQDDSDVYYYVIVHGGPYFGVSPEMGFPRNLDQWPWLAFRKPFVTVTADWGWDELPADVKLATAITAQELLGVGGGTGGKSEGLTSEAIEGWSRAWGSRQGGGQSLAIPNRARDLLVSYQRIFV